MVCYQAGDKTGELGWRVGRVKIAYLIPWPALPVGLQGETKGETVERRLEERICLVS